MGVRMQSAMAHAVPEVKRATGARVDLDAVPTGDPATYQLIRSTETLGCFQIESPGQRDLVGRLQPATFHDLVVDISLFRPGPVAAGMVRPLSSIRLREASMESTPSPALSRSAEERSGSPEEPPPEEPPPGEPPAEEPRRTRTRALGRVPSWPTAE